MSLLFLDLRRGAGQLCSWGPAIEVEAIVRVMCEPERKRVCPGLALVLRHLALAVTA
jgi:hypothetical protein